MFISQYKHVFATNIDINALSDINDLAEQTVVNHLTSGIVVMVIHNNKIVYNESFGYSYLHNNGNIVNNPVKMTTDNIFDLASLTKVMATTQAIMILLNENKIKLTDRVSKYLPDFASNGKENILIEDLLTHTSGLPAGKPLYFHAENPQEALHYINQLSLVYERGSKKVCSDLGFIILGFIVEKISKQPLDKFVINKIYKPLHMDNTAFILNDAQKIQAVHTSFGDEYEASFQLKDKIAGYYDDIPDLLSFQKWRKYTLYGEVNDGNSYHVFNGVSGHAGLFSNVHDLSILIRLMLNGGYYGNVKLYDPVMIKLFTTEHKFSQSLGFEVDQNYYMGNLAPKGTFGHTGFTGTCLVANNELKTAIIVLSNKQNVGLNEKGVYATPRVLCGEIMDVVWQAIK